MRTILALVLALPLGGCFLTPNVPAQPSPAQLSSSEQRQQVTAVQLSTACLKFLKQTQHPASPKDERTVGMNAKVAWRLSDHAISVGNGKIIKAAECLRQEAHEYAAGLRVK